MNATKTGTTAPAAPAAANATKSRKGQGKNKGSAPIPAPAVEPSALTANETKATKNVEHLRDLIRREMADDAERRDYDIEINSIRVKAELLASIPGEKKLQTAEATTTSLAIGEAVLRMQDNLARWAVYETMKAFVLAEDIAIKAARLSQVVKAAKKSLFLVTSDNAELVDALTVTGPFNTEYLLRALPDDEKKIVAAVITIADELTTVRMDKSGAVLTNALVKRVVKRLEEESKADAEDDSEGSSECTRKIADVDIVAELRALVESLRKEVAELKAEFEARGPRLSAPLRLVDDKPDPSSSGPQANTDAEATESPATVRESFETVDLRTLPGIADDEPRGDDLPAPRTAADLAALIEGRRYDFFEPDGDFEPVRYKVTRDVELIDIGKKILQVKAKPTARPTGMLDILRHRIVKFVDVTPAAPTTPAPPADSQDDHRSDAEPEATGTPDKVGGTPCQGPVAVPGEPAGATGPPSPGLAKDRNGYPYFYPARDGRPYSVAETMGSLEAGAGDGRAWTIEDLLAAPTVESDDRFSEDDKRAAIVTYVDRVIKDMESAGRRVDMDDEGEDEGDPAPKLTFAPDEDDEDDDD